MSLEKTVIKKIFELMFGDDDTLKTYEGVVSAIIEYADYYKYKLIIVADNKEYSNAEIRKILDTEDKLNKYKLIR